MMRMWIPLSPESDSSASGDRLTPCERANLTGFSCQPFTVLIIASMSRAEITDVEQGEKKRASFTTHAKNPSPSISHDYLWMSLAFTKQIKKFLQFLIFFFLPNYWNVHERKSTLLHGFPTRNPFLPSHCLKPSSPTSIWSGFWNSHQ